MRFFCFWYLFCSEISVALHLSVRLSIQLSILYDKAKSLCIYLFVCTFAPSLVLLMNRLTQALKIRIDYSVNFSWSSKHIFNFVRFVIQKLRVLKKRCERFSIHIEKSKYTRPFFTLHHWRWGQNY